MTLVVKYTKSIQARYVNIKIDVDVGFNFDDDDVDVYLKQW